MRDQFDNKVPRGLKPLQKSFFNLLGQEKPKPIPPKLVRIYGYPLSAMISQLLFWNGMGARKDGYIFKTEKDFLNELGLSSAQQKLAINKAKSFGFFKVVRKGIPAKIKGTGKSDDDGVLRIHFPENSDSDNFQEISWEDFFAEFDEKELDFLYQDKKADGETSTFHKFVSRK